MPRPHGKGEKIHPTISVRTLFPCNGRGLAYAHAGWQTEEACISCIRWLAFCWVPLEADTDFWYLSPNILVSPWKKRRISNSVIAMPLSPGWTWHLCLALWGSHVWGCSKHTWSPGHGCCLPDTFPVCCDSSLLFTVRRLGNLWDGRPLHLWAPAAHICCLSPASTTFSTQELCLPGNPAPCTRRPPALWAGQPTRPRCRVLSQPLQALTFQRLLLAYLGMLPTVANLLKGCGYFCSALVFFLSSSVPPG